MIRKPAYPASVCAVLAALTACTAPGPVPEEPVDKREWLAGDHHIHSRYSVGWDNETDPPTPQIGGDAIYPIQMNALMAGYFGLSWTVVTDHGGPNHSKINLESAYPELLQSRLVVPDVVQFYGLELDTPAGEHSTLMVPHTHDEADVLFQLESQFDTVEVFPVDPARDTEEKMTEALGVMSGLERPPVVIVNHPARTVTSDGAYGAYHPAELRRWNDVAPDVAVGMAGAPGHQAVALTTNPAATDPSRLVRGGYRGFPTIGGFDVFTARLGGLWDSMLAEGRHWWITANSDSHIHYTEGGFDFWPGEYSKTYVYAEKNHDSIIEALRAGHVFVTTGDLISELFVDVSHGERAAMIGETLSVAPSSEITVTVRVTDPEAQNPAGDDPHVKRVDLIVGDVTGPAADPAIDRNETTRVAYRFTAQDWRRQNGVLTMSRTIPVNGPMYLRVRGTNTDELEPERDPPAENPWDDLWFYSNPVFVDIR